MLLANMKRVEAHIESGGVFKNAPVSYSIIRNHGKRDPAWFIRLRDQSIANAYARRSQDTRAALARRTHCRKGHEFTGDNSVMISKFGVERRVCAICLRAALERKEQLTYSEDRFTQLIKFVKQGGTISQASQRTSERPLIMKFNAIKAAFAANPKIADQLRKRSAANAAKHRADALSNKRRGGYVHDGKAAPPISDVIAAQILAGARDGASMWQLVRGKYRLVGQGQFDRYAKAHPDWSREVRALFDRNRSINRGAQQRNKEFCLRGHSLADARVDFHEGRFKRTCRSCLREGHLLGKPMTDQTAQQVRIRLSEGSTLSELMGSPQNGKRDRSKYLVAANSLYLYRRSNPSFEAAIAPFIERNRERAKDRQRTHLRTAVARRDVNDYDIISSMVPTSIERHMRDDIISTVFLDILEGRISKEQVKDRVRDYVRQQNKLFRGFTKYAAPSLDAPAYFDSKIPLIETLSSEDSIWEHI
ncbi:hypothetical protein [Tardiphaga robiniae]|uniref:hypothetical protein n=1 Tax=Tardiphaga robiniae TaxID=943830 RepID=UPI001586BA71|nr:hypothetical protein [Tardiphaga robiniae]NUU40365.1 hypothetical protein [Tardiphaga robiniae]